MAVARTGPRSGADYYLAPSGAPVDDLENCFRLEVSGTALDETEFRRRLSVKVKQARARTSVAPALAAVVGFQIRKIAICSVEAEP